MSWRLRTLPVGWRGFNSAAASACAVRVQRRGVPCSIRCISEHNAGLWRGRREQQLHTGLLRRCPAADAQKKEQNDWKSIPNMLTIGRLFAIPGLVASWHLGLPSVSAVLFGTAAATDWLDGYLARRWGQQSALGALLDPLADKLLVMATLLILVENCSGPIVTLPAVAILAREIGVSSLREWMAINRPGASNGVAVAWHGKAKTALQLISLQAMLAGVALADFNSQDNHEHDSRGGENGVKEPGSEHVLYTAGVGLLWLASFATLASGFQYARIAASCL